MISRQSPKEAGARMGQLTMSEVLIVQVTPLMVYCWRSFQTFAIVLPVLGIAGIVRSQGTEETLWEA